MRCRLCVAAVLALLAFPGAAQATQSWSAPISVDQAGSGSLRSVACPSSTQCTAVDYDGQEVTFNPRSPGTPTPVTVDGGSRLSSVACPSSTQCTAVDEDGGQVTFNPQAPGAPTPTQLVVSGYSGQPLSGVACPAVTQCTAVTKEISDKLHAPGLEVTFNPQSPGSPAQTTITSGEGLGGVACPSSTQCTAVDEGGNEITFNPQSPGTPAPVTIGGKGLGHVACPSSTQCTSVDNGGQEVTFNPQSPGTVTPVTINTDYLGGVGCPSSTQCTAIAFGGHQATFNPQSPGTPTPTTIDTGDVLTGVACPSSTQCTAVDILGQEVTFNPQSPGTPTPTTIDKVTALTSVACPSSTQCTAVDQGGDGVTFNPQSPGPTTSVTIYNSSLRGVACPSSTQCTAVGQNGIEVTFNPQSPGTPTPVVIGGGNLGRVACPSSTQCTAVDNENHEITFNPQSPGTPTPVTIFAGRPNASNGVACPSSTQCTALQFGSEVTFNPQSPGTPTALEFGTEFLGIACASSVQCAAVGGEGGKEVTFDPTAPGTTSVVTIDSGHYGSQILNAVACPSSTQCTAVDRSGHAVTFNPTAPGSATVERIAGASELRAISCSSAMQCVAVDDTGHAFVGTGTASPPVTVTSVEAASGPSSGGSAVTVKGSGFLNGATVTIGSAATSVEVVSESEIRARTAVTPPGVDEVIVSDANGTSAAGPAYTYIAQGTWTGVVGFQGYDLAGWDGVGDVGYISGVTTTLVQGSRYQWASSTSDARALQGPDGLTRNAATYYDPKEINVQLQFSGAYSGDLHLYAVDWDSTARRELISVNGYWIAALSGNFNQGAWASVPISVAAGGKVTITVRRQAGSNAVLSGIFLGDGGAPPAPAVNSAPQGAWSGPVGSEGYDLAGWDGPMGDASYLPHASLSLPQGSRYLWAQGTGDARALSDPSGLTHNAGTYYDPNQIQLKLSFPAAYSGNLHLYAVDWDSTARRETISVNGSSVALGEFNKGAWVSFPISVAAGGTVTITVDRTAGANAVLSGIFLGDSGTPPAIALSSAPQGSWVGTYGSGGYDLLGFSGSSDLSSLTNPSVTVEQASRYTWSSSTTDARALQSPDKSARLAATLYDPNQIKLALHFTAPYSGNLELYAVDWDSTTRREMISVGGQTADLSSSFSQGAWVSFPISVAAGETVSIVVDRTAGANAVLSGIFLG